jgi:lysosomal Pro-X carboxypeptidase
MFPKREWSLEWLNHHCEVRFGVSPMPWKLVKKWQWDKLVEVGASHIIFTNGLKDGWSVSGIQENLSETLLALNFENGAHHSDLSGRGPSEDDTSDIRAGFLVIEQILAGWVKQVKASKLVGRSPDVPSYSS